VTAALLVQVIPAAGVKKDKKWIVETHEQIAAELTGGDDSKIYGFMMDNTKANRAAMQQMEDNHPQWLNIGCQAHNLSLLVKDFIKPVSKYNSSPRGGCIGEVLESARQLVGAIGDNERLRAAIHEAQVETYGKVSFRQKAQSFVWQHIVLIQCFACDVGERVPSTLPNPLWHVCLHWS
jgi:hypothetical protein